MAIQPSRITSTIVRSTPRNLPALRLKVVPQLTVVLVNYLHWDETVQLVRQLRHNDLLRAGEAEVVVIDNHSPVDPRMKLLERWDGVQLRRWQTNRGFSRAVNAGVRLGSGDWYLFLNPDMSAEDGFLDEALALAERRRQQDPRLGILGFQVRNTNGSRQLSTGPFPTLVNTLARLLLPRSRRKYSEPPEQGGQVSWVTGCCLMIHRDCLEDINGFDENFFLYYEDVDLCLRASERGWTVGYEPSLSITHHHPLHQRTVTPTLRTVTRHSLLTYARKHWSRGQTRILSWIIRAEACFRACLSSVRGDSLAAAQFRDLGKISSSLGRGDVEQARSILRKVIRRGEESQAVCIRARG